MTINFKKSLNFITAISARLWHGLTEPFESLPEAGDERRSVATTGFLLLAILAVSLEQFLAGNTPVISLAFLIGGYFLARTRGFRYAALILIFSLSFPSYLFVLRLPSPEPQRVLFGFAWLLIPLLITSLIYPLRATIALGAINLLVLAVLPVIRPELTFRLIGATWGFYGLTMGILVLVMNQRNQIEHDRQKELILNREALSQEIKERERFAERSQRQADQLTMLYKISNAISNLQDLESILQLIFEKVKSNIHLDVFFIALYDEKSNIVSFPLMYDGGSFWKQPDKNLRETTSLSKVIATGEALFWNRSPAEIESAGISTNRVGDPNRVAASIIVIPLQASGNIVGAISVQSYETNAYHADHVQLLTALSQQVTVAIENARLYDAANQRAQRLTILNEVSRAVAELKDLPDLLETVYQLVMQSISMDAFFVGLHQPGTREISFPIMYDEGRRYQPETGLISEGSFLDRLLKGENAFLINRTAEEIGTHLNQKQMLGNDAKPSASLMVAPLKSGEQVIGLISAQSYTIHAYDEADLSLLLGIANQVAVAIQNARLLEEVQQNAQYLSILNEVGHAVSELRDLPQLLEVVYDQVKYNVRVDAFFVGLYHPESNTVSYPISYDDGVRYESPTENVSSTSYLHRLLHGESAMLTNRSAEELGTPPSKERAFGNPSKKSASLINAPLTIGEQVIGVMSAQSYTLNAYKKDDLTLMIGIARQVSIALANSRLYTSAQQEITERQKVEEQLRTAEAKYRELVERSPAVIYNSETGATGRWFYVSPQIETLLGFTAEEWYADPHLWYQQIHPEDREYAVTTEAIAIAENRSVEIEYRMYTKDGRLIWIHDESLNVSISDNQQYIVQGILTNVTSRKQAEFKLKESEEKYHFLFNTSERQARELTLLGEVQSALARELELSILLKTVVEAVAKTFGYTFVSLYILENDFLQLQHQVGYETRYVIERISAKEGVSGKVIRTGLPVLIQDVAQDANFLRASPLIKSEICVPLFDNNRIFGILNVESSPEFQLTEDDLRLMNRLSEQINVAIRRARLYAERAESLKREQHINDFAHAINSTHELADILELVARLSAEMVGADGGSVSIMSDDGMTMTDVYSYHEDTDLDIVIQKGKGITWWTYEKGRPIILDEYSQHPDATEILTASAIHAFMGVPISIGEKRLGAIAFYNKSPQKKFTLRDLSLIETVAQEIAVAIQNARLIEELQKERDFAVQIMSLLGQGISVSTLDNKFEYVNPALAKTLGYEPGEMIGQDIERFLMPGELERFESESGNQASGEATSLEIKIKHKDGHPVHALVTRVPRFSGNTATGSIASITDLSERKQIELEREILLKDMEAKNAELERFTYTVSHDLKSPLVTIGGFLGFLQADIKNGDHQRVERTIHRIRDATKKMQRLLDELLELSRVGRLANPSGDIPFGELVDEALELVAGQLSERQVQVEVEAGLPMVRVDRVRMIEVLQNLLVNSTKFMGAQEHPTIQIGMKIINNQKTFFVRDNGIGIASEFHDRIFGLFNKLDTLSEGTGIGLALVKRIIEVHGGRIWVESELGKSATFFFTLAENK